MVSHQRIQIGLALRASLVLLAFVVISRRMDLLSIREHLLRLFHKRCHRGSNTRVEREIRVAVDFAARFIPGSSCAARSLAMMALLLSKGYPCALQIGVRRTPLGYLSAHAWVINQSGEVVSEAGEQIHGFFRVGLPASPF